MKIQFIRLSRIHRTLQVQSKSTDVSNLPMINGTMGSLSEAVAAETFAEMDERVELKVGTPSLVRRAALQSFLIDVLLGTPRLITTFP